MSSAVTVETLVANIENRLKDSGKWEQFSTDLSACQSDFDRLNLLFSTAEVSESVKPQIVQQEKSIEEAEKFRTAGNEHFKAAHYDRALECYSQAIRFAPVACAENDWSPVLALCFGNRSAAFFHLKQFHLCLLDIENALEAGVPPSSLPKLLDRQGKCCLFLKRKQEAVAAFERARQCLQEASDMPEKGRQDMLFLTDQFLKKCRSLPEGGEGEEEGVEYVHTPLPTLAATSPQIPCVADFVSLRFDEVQGRGLYAKRDIKVGEVLIVEKPYASVVLSDHMLTHCHHCCVRCFVPLPCQQCVDVVFCSRQCRQAALQAYHPMECGMVACFQKADIRLGHLAYRMVAKAGFDYLMRQRDALEHPSVQDPGQLGLDEKGVYDSENYATMYHLVGHSSERTVKDMFSRSVKALFLLRCLQQTCFFSSLENSSEASNCLYPLEENRQADVCYIGSHILRHLQMLPCNAHEVSELGINWEEPSASLTLEIGSAIYPVLSLINHSCDPSVVRHSYADICVVRSIRSIPAGEEIYDNYGALHPVMEYSSRQKHLQKQYFFECKCEACVKKWPLYIDIPRDTMYFYCERCKGRVPVPAVANASTLDTIACLDCGRKQNIRNHILKVGSMEKNFQDTLHRVIFTLDVEGDALQKLVQFLRVVDKYVHRPFSSHNDCQEAIKLCYAYKANAFPRARRTAVKAS